MRKITPDIIDRVKKIRELSKIPMKTEQETKRVDIIMLKYKEEPRVIDKAISLIVNNTDWPFKLTVYDNRLNTANTARIWNKLIAESTCDYQLVIDSDAFVSRSEPCWLTRLMENIDECGIVYPVGDNVGGLNGGVAVPEPYGSKVKLPEDIKIDDVAIGDRVCSGYCFLIKREALKKAGWFDENFYIYGEDSEWSWRAIKTIGTIIRRDVFVSHLSSYSFDKADKEGEVDKFADKEYARRLFCYKTGIK